MTANEEHPAAHRIADEIANAVTHGLGLILSLIGLPVLVVSAAAHGDALNVVGASVFGATLVALYAASTLYHAVQTARVKRVLRVVDHVAIYLLIAGTYTPFTLGVLRGAWGWTLFGIIWGLAALGVLFKLVLGMRYPRASTVFYLAMGWVMIIAIRPLMLSLPAAGLWLLAAGGLFYSGGVVFYVSKRHRYLHAVWHLCVMAGSFCHFLAVWHYA
jgi:hemolysin III